MPKNPESLIRHFDELSELVLANRLVRQSFDDIEHPMVEYLDRIMTEVTWDREVPMHYLPNAPAQLVTELIAAQAMTEDGSWAAAQASFMLARLVNVQEVDLSEVMATV